MSEKTSIQEKEVLVNLASPVLEGNNVPFQH